MFLESMLLGLIIGKFRGGKINNIGNKRIKGWILLVIALIIQIISINVDSSGVLGKVIPYAYGTSLSLILLCMLINLGEKTLWLAFVGVALNLVVLAVNKNSMPLDMNVLASNTVLIDKLVNNKLINYVDLNTVEMSLTYLGRIILVKVPYMRNYILSIGDIFINMGILLFIQSSMNKRLYSGYNFGSRTKMIKFKYNGNK